MEFLVSLLRALLTALTAVAVLLSLAAVGWNALLISWHADECRMLSQSIPSPDGSWVVERYICRYDNVDDEEELSLRRSAEPAGEARYPFLHVGSTYQHGVKWLDNTHLLVVSDGSRNYLKRLTSYRGIDIVYETYSSDPDVSRNQATSSIEELASVFLANFRRTDNSSKLEYATCFLGLGTTFGKKSDALSVGLYARKFYDKVFKLYNSSESDYTDYHIIIDHIVDSSVSSPSVTAASFNGRLPLAKSSPLFDRGLSGRQEPVRRTRWELKKSELHSFFESIQRNDFKISLGFWLENAQINFHSENEIDSNAIDGFKNCLNDHGL